MMTEVTVRIVRLEPMSVASFHALSANPEHDAWNRLEAWARPRGLFVQPSKHRIFGFNNPSPSAGSPNYGYEFWIQVAPETVSDDQATIRFFAGGLYAVTDFQGRGEAIPARWKQLSIWCENSPYKFAHHQWLEEHRGGGGTSDRLGLDLYLPIME